MSEREKQARKRFADRKWDSLEAMIKAYAAEAVAIARVDFHEDIAELGERGETTASTVLLDRLERILNRICPAPEPLPLGDGEWQTLLWGSWFGEFLRRMHGGEWQMTVYPGSDFSVPTLEIAGSRLYPMLKVHRRLTMGAGEGIPTFYGMLSARLSGLQPRVN